MSKKIVLLLVPLGILAFGAALLLSNGDQDTSISELREKFRCDRITADLNATDIYCQNPDYYYEDVKNGTVIEDSDFGDPRFRALFDNN